MKTVLCLLALAASASGGVVRPEPLPETEWRSPVTLTVFFNHKSRTFDSTVVDKTSKAMLDFCKINPAHPDAVNGLSVDISNVRPDMENLGQTLADVQFYIKEGKTVNRQREAVEGCTKLMVEEGAATRQNYGSKPYKRVFNDTEGLEFIRHVQVDCPEWNKQPATLRKTAGYEWVNRHQFGTFYHQCADDDSTTVGLGLGYAGLAVTGLGFLIGMSALLTGNSGKATGPAPSKLDDSI